MDIKIVEKDLSKVLSAAIIMQLSPEAQSTLIENAVSSYLLAKSSSYGSKTQIEKLVDESVDRAVRFAFDELLTKEPYKSRFMVMAKAELDRIFEAGGQELRKLVDVAISNAMKSTVAKTAHGY